MANLKDLNEDFLQSKGYKIFCPVGIKILRNEAIKQAKKTIQERDKYGNPEVNTTAWCGKEAMKVQLHWIKQFFNITEEDLK